MAFRFVHTADIHLDSPLRSLAMRNGELADAIGTATRETFRKTIDLCIYKQVHALIIAGDLYDGDQTSMKTARFLVNQLDRLNQHNIHVFIIKGNHDAESGITRQLVLPGNVTVFSTIPEIHKIQHNQLNIAIHGVSFASKHVPESLLDKFSAPVANSINIGMLHTSLGGSSVHDPYAPCTVQELQNTGFNYWALGHIHKRAEYPGKTTVVMPGIPQGRDIGEAGLKTVSLVSINSYGNVEVTEHCMASAQFERIEIDTTHIDTWQDLISELRQSITMASVGFSDIRLVLRLKMTGHGNLNWQISMNLDLLFEEATRITENLEMVWIDKIENDTRKFESQKELAGPLASLSEMLTKESMHSILDNEARDYVEKLSKSLPPVVRDVLGSNEDEANEICWNLLKEGSDYVLANLGNTSRLDN